MKVEDLRMIRRALTYYKADDDEWEDYVSVLTRIEQEEWYLEELENS